MSYFASYFPIFTAIQIIEKNKKLQKKRTKRAKRKVKSYSKTVIKFA